MKQNLLRRILIVLVLVMMLCIFYSFMELSFYMLYHNPPELCNDIFNGYGFFEYCSSPSGSPPLVGTRRFLIVTEIVAGCVFLLALITMIFLKRIYNKNQL